MTIIETKEELIAYVLSLPERPQDDYRFTDGSTPPIGFIRMTNRPTSKDLAVRLEAAEKALPEVMEWLYETLPDEELVTNPDLSPEAMRNQIKENIAAAFNRCSDGYEICRFLENEFGWLPDAQLVEILDQQFLWEAERLAIMEWAKTANIEPQHIVGNQVSFKLDDNTYTAGTIDSIYNDVASYLIRLDHRGDVFVVIPWEAVKTLPLEDSEKPESFETHPDTVDETSM